jgi:hypothetical protein
MPCAREKALHDGLRHAIVGEEIAARDHVLNPRFRPDAEGIWTEWMAVVPFASTASTCRYSMNLLRILISATAAWALMPLSMRSRRGARATGRSRSARRRHQLRPARRRSARRRRARRRTPPHRTCRFLGNGPPGKTSWAHSRIDVGSKQGLRLQTQSGMTAVPSISTSHSGRASACTTTPVDTGCTPLMYLPMVRYTASRWRMSVM